MPNAVRFWGAQAGGTADGWDSTCIALTNTSPASGSATCNGNGDGMINPNTLEEFRFWQHLANAGLIEGQYTGVYALTGSIGSNQPGLNVPRSKLSNAGWSMLWYGVISSASVPYMYSGTYNNIFFFGASSTCCELANAVLKPEEAWNVDTKLDDGKPATGNIRTRNSDATSNIPNCTTSTDPTVAAYNLSYSSVACSLMIISGF